MLFILQHTFCFRLLRLLRTSYDPLVGASGQFASVDRSGAATTCAPPLARQKRQLDCITS